MTLTNIFRTWSPPVRWQWQVDLLFWLITVGILLMSLLFLLSHQSPQPFLVVWTNLSWVIAWTIGWWFWRRRLYLFMLSLVAAGLQLVLLVWSLWGMLPA